jgi:hypothetical protein
MRNVLLALTAALPLSACAIDYGGPGYLGSSYYGYGDSCPVGYYRYGNICRSYAADNRNNVYVYRGSYGAYRQPTHPAYPRQSYGRSGYDSGRSAYYGAYQPRARDDSRLVTRNERVERNGRNDSRLLERHYRVDRNSSSRSGGRSSGGRRGRH